jgi:DNA replication protein DnaC
MKIPTHELFKKLKLSAFSENIDKLSKLGETKDWSYGQFLHEICTLEIDSRAEKRTERLLKQARIPPKYSLENLDRKLLTPKIRKVLPSLLDGDFVEKAENILSFGLPGRGKSHLLGAIGRELILRHNISVYFSSTFKIVESLLIAKKNLELERALKKLDKYDVIILDDIGYVQQDKHEMEVLFTLLAERYERKSLMISSNLVFSKWDNIFKDTMTTMAAIDRLVHHSIILEHTGPSIREAEAKIKKSENS